LGQKMDADAARGRDRPKWPLPVEQGEFLKEGPGASSGPVGRFASNFLNWREAPVSFVGGRTKFYVAALRRSVPPSAGAVNPALSIIALARRTGDHIAGSLLAPVPARAVVSLRPQES
jgi:hypothetical protein